MKKAAILLFFFAVASFIFANITSDFSDLPIAVLVQKHNKKELISWQRTEILKEQKISGEFKASEDNLGILAFRFVNPYGGGNIDKLIFRLKEKGKENWYYENSYAVDQFQSDNLFPFGFPQIPESQGKTYDFEIESVYGKAGNAVSVSPLEPIFVTKYKFDKQELLSDKKELVLFLAKKLRNYLGVYEVVAALGISALVLICGSCPRKKLESFYGVNALGNKSSRLPWKICSQIFQGSRHPHIKIDVLAMISLFLLTLAISGYFSTLGVYPRHDGILLKPAIDVANGKMLFRDTYTQYGAATTLIQAAFIRTFGEYLLVIRLTTALFYAATGIFLYLVFKRILGRWLAFVACLIWIAIATYLKSTFLPWSSVYAMFFQILSLYLLYKYMERSSLRYLFYCGVSTALALWSRLPVGICLFAAYILFFILWKLKSSIKTIFFFCTGFIGVNLGFTLWLLINRAFYDWWRQSVGFAYFFGRSLGEDYGFLKILLSLFPLSRPKTPFHYYSDVLWILLPVSCVIIFFILLWQVKRRRKMATYESELLALTVISLFSWLQYYPIAERQHFYWAATPMIGVMVYALWRLANYLALKLNKSNRTNRSNRVVQLLLLFAALYAVFWPVINDRMQKAQFRLRAPYETVEKPKVLKWMKLSKNEMILYRDIANGIDSYLGENPQAKLVSSYPDALFLTFLDNNENVYKLYILNNPEAEMIYPEYKEKFRQFIKEKGPLIIALDSEVFADYCQSYIPDISDNITVKVPYGGKNRFEILDTVKKQKSLSFVIKVNNKEIEIIDALLQEVDSSKKIRRWGSREKLVIEKHSQGIYYLQLDEEIHEGAETILKILFAGDKCYLEKIL